MGKGIVEVGINQGYEFVMLQDNQRLRDVRHVIQFAFYLFGINVLSAGSEKHILAAPAYGNVAVGIHCGEVACVQPAVDIYDLGSGFGILVIAQHKVASPADDFARYMLRIGRIYLYFHAGGGFSARGQFQGFPTAGTDDRTAFRHAVGNGVGEAYLFEEAFHVGVEGCAADDDFIEIAAEDIHSLFAHVRFYLIVDDRHP